MAAGASSFTVKSCFGALLAAVNVRAGSGASAVGAGVSAAGSAGVTATALGSSIGLYDPGLPEYCINTCW